MNGPHWTVETVDGVCFYFRKEDEVKARLFVLRYLEANLEIPSDEIPECLQERYVRVEYHHPQK